MMQNKMMHRALGLGTLTWRILPKRIAELTDTVPTSGSLRNGAFRTILETSLPLPAVMAISADQWHGSRLHCRRIVYVRDAGNNASWHRWHRSRGIPLNDRLS